MEEVLRKEKGYIKRKTIDIISKICLIICAMVSILAIITITIYLLAQSIPGIAQVGLFKFLLGTNWAPSDTSIPENERFGILPMIVGSLSVAAGSILVGGVLGVFSAVFIARFCPKKIKGAVKLVINLLAGLPSIIYGFFGMKVLIPMIKEFALDIGIRNAVSGHGIFVCSLVLGIMILPIVISLSVNAMEAQPESYFEGALALGSTKEQAVYKVLLPAGKSGVLTGLVLGIGRALGETMAVVMICGNRADFPDSIFHSMRTLTANIVLELSYAENLHRDMLIATGLVLFVFVMLLTLSVNVLRKNKR